MAKSGIISLLLIAITLSVMAQGHTVVFYNVENMFDTINDPATYDEDMLPLADRKWNSQRYRAKLQLIANTLTNISDEYPALIGLAEVENRNVLNDLIHTSPLAASHYAVCHYDSPDERGIDVALLYRPEIFHYYGSRAITAATQNPTRDILTVWGRMNNHPTFIIVLHWTSRIGGVKFSEVNRRICAQQVRDIVDSVIAADPTTRIIIMGDMNDNPRNNSIAVDLRARRRPNLTGDLYNPFAKIWSARRGSSVYDGRWNQYDNIIVSPNTPLLPIRREEYAAIYSCDVLLSRRRTPRPTYSGSNYEGGASDHLPIYIVIGE